MALIIGGEPIDCMAHVVDWRSHGKQFTPDMKNIGRRGRRPKPELLVAHWTGGERGHEGVYSTLKNRGYGCGFTMDYYGTIWQYCDPYEIYTAHAGGMNLVSMGLEIQSQGVYPHPQWSKATQARMDKKWQRGRYRAEVAGEERSMVLFTAEQVEAFIQFCDALAEAEVIPREVPLQPENMVIHGEDGDVECGLLDTERFPKQLRKNLKGVCGHFHVHDSKLDPGPQLLEELIEHWGLAA